MKKINLYETKEYTIEEKKSIENYSKAFSFDVAIQSMLEKEGVKLSKQSIQKEIKTNNNIEFITLDGFELWMYEANKASNRIINLLKTGSIRKDFLSQDCRKAGLLGFIKEIKGIEYDISSTLNPTLDKVHTKFLFQNKKFAKICNQAKALQKKIKKNRDKEDIRNAKVIHKYMIEEFTQ